MGLNELIVRIGGDTAGLETMLERLARPFRSLQNTTRQFTSSAQNSFNSMSSRVQNSMNNMNSRITSRMNNIRSRINEALSGRNPAFNQFVMNCGRMSQNIQRFAQNGIRQLRNFGRGVSNAAKKLKDFAKEAGPKLSGVGQSMTMGLSLPIVAAGGYMLKTSGDFEAALSSIKAVTLSSGKTMTKVKALALDMGAKTKYSALEAAEGIEVLLKSGVSLKEVMGGGLEGTLALATAGELELAEAADIASTALNTFKKDSLSVAKAADIMAGADLASATTVGELKYALASVAGVADGVGMSFMDTATALSYFGQNGLKGSDAGTSLKTMLLNLDPQTNKATATFERLGLMTFDSAKAMSFLQKNGIKPTGKSLDDLRGNFQKLAEQMDEGKIGTKENAKFAEEMLKQFNSSAFYDAKGNIKSLADISGLLKKQLDKLNPRERATALKEMFGTDAYRAAQYLYKAGEKGIKDQQKAMTKVKATDVARKKLENFNGAIENLKGSLETLAINVMFPFLKPLAKVALAFADLSNAIGKLPTPVTNFGVIFAGILAVIGPVVMAIGGLLTLFGGIAIPVGIAVVAIAALAAAFVIMAQKSGLITVVKQKFMQIWAAIQQTFKLIKPYIMQFINWILPYIQKNFGYFKTIVALAMDNILRIINIVNAIIKGDWAAVWSNIKIIFFNILRQIGAVVLWAMNSFKGILSVGWKIIVALAKWAWNTIKLAVVNALRKMAAIVGSVSGATKRLLINAWNSVRSSTINAWNRIKSGVTGAASRVKSAVFSMVDYIRSRISGLVSSAYNWGKNMIGGFLKGIKSKVQAVKDSVSSIAGIVGQYIGCGSPTEKGPLKNLYEWGKGLTEGYAEGMLMNERLIAKAASNMATTTGIEMNTTKTGNNGTGSGFVYNQNGPVLNQQTIQQIANMLARKMKTGGI